MVQRTWNAWNMNQKQIVFILWSQTSHLIFKDSAIDYGGGFPSWRGFKFETGDLQKRWKHDCSWRDPILWFQTGQGVVSERNVVNFKILVARYEGCFACNRSARQTCVGIFVTNNLCPSRSLLSSLPCHHHHHHRNHHHFLAYTRPQPCFPRLFLARRNLLPGSLWWYMRYF